MSNPFVAVIASLTEAWGELRVNRGRVIVSLIGVTVAVAALTTAVALGAIAQQGVVENTERFGGRAATLTLNAYSTDGSALDQDELQHAAQAAVSRYEIGHHSRRGYATARLQLPTGVIDQGLQLVDPQYNVIFRAPISEGRWFTERDLDALAPRVIVGPNLYAQLGSPDLTRHPTVTVLTPEETTAVIVGVGDARMDGLFALAGSAERLVSAEQQQWLSFEHIFWVPDANAEALRERLVSDIGSALSGEVQVDAWRTDFMAQSGGEDPFAGLRLILGGIAGLILFLGALGLINVAIVTVRQRIREIGIRRSLGATSSRVFTVVLVENVVATMLAGVVGVMLAVAILRFPPVIEALNMSQLMDAPQFPMDAALLGFVCATAVGALAGLIPAVVAMRVKVIDAIRF